MGRSKSIPQFGSGQDYGKRILTSLASGSIMKDWQDIIMYLMNADEAYFGGPWKGIFDANELHRPDNIFFTSLETLLSTFADVECDLP